MSHKPTLVKYYLAVKNNQEQFPFVKKMELDGNRDDKGYTITKVSSLEQATIYEKQEVVLMFATDPSLPSKLQVFEVQYSQNPVEVRLDIGGTSSMR